MIIKKNSLLITGITIYAFLFYCFFPNQLNPHKFENSKTNQQKKVIFQKRSKFVSFECHMETCGGLADRFKGIMNAYAWSLFTNRKFFINISEPCKFLNLITPNEVQWNVSLDELVKTGDLIKNQIDLKKIMDFKFRDDLVNIDILNYKRDIDIIRIYTNIEWFSSYSRNKYLFDNGMISGENVNISIAMNKWFNKLFKLNSRIQPLFDIYLKKFKPRRSTKLICAQVRIGGKRPNVENDLVFAPRSYSKFYWDYIKNNFLKHVSDYKIFVTADMKSVEDEAVKMFEQKNIEIIEGLSTHMDSERKKKEDCTRYDKVVMDFFMLGHCDMAVVSNSGFGIFGVLRNKYLINSQNFVVFDAKASNFSTLYKFINANPTRF